MNILLTSVGRRAYLVKYFKEALGNQGQVHVCNSNDKSIAFKYADKKIISPLIYDKEYIPFLLEYCKKNLIKVVISLFDIDLLILAKHKEDFEKIGVNVIVSNEKVISICNDKWLNYCFLKDNNFLVPRSYIDIKKLQDDLKKSLVTYPIVVKPRYGCGSILIEYAYDEEDLYYLTKKLRREINKTYLKYESAMSDDMVIYQECIKGQEYGADIINDLQGNVQNVIVRKKIAMRSGETDIAEIVDMPLIKDTLFQLGEVVKHEGNMDCDVFLVDNKVFILEMNARFGGGYPFSHLGGCNLPQAIINWCIGNPVPLEMISAQPGVVGFKEIYISQWNTGLKG